LAYQDLSDVVDEVIPYCFRPENNLDESFEFSVDPLSQKLSFEELRMANTTSLQLLSWSIPIEVVERYQLYLNEPNSALNEYIYNCSEGRFGLKCQYSFAFNEGMSFDQIVEADFRGRIGYSESNDMMVQMPCYVFLNCHRNGQPWCLDWREVCDGKIDCFDEGLDEESCFDMEIKESSEDEYRCHNGLCISQEQWEDGMGDTDCLDRSDSAIDFSYINTCFQDPTFRCEEHSCGTNVNLFSCGDGQCVAKFEECHNGRHLLLIDSMAAKGNLAKECWIAMSCLTGLVQKGNEILCKIWLMNDSTVYTALEQCKSFFKFPTIPAHSDHIRFLYKDLHLKSNVNQFLLPDYVFYDQQLYDSIAPDLVHKNLTCLNESELILALNKYFCQCFFNWLGIQYKILMNCRACSSDSICIGLTNNQAMRVCPIDKFGPRYLLTSTCPINACQNNGQCVQGDVNIPGSNYTCICSDRFFGRNCEHQKAELDVSLDKIDIPAYIVAYFFSLSNEAEPIETTVLRKLTLFQHTVIFHIAVPFQLTYIQAGGKYYLVPLQQSSKTSISTSISPKQECKNVEQINSTVSEMFQFQRIRNFHYFCQTDFNLTCFVDKNYLCSCTNDDHANCVKFNSERNFQCPSNNYCENGGECLQDNPTCPSTKICLCPSYFFGDRCQFYAKCLGSTLDEILGYEIKRNTLLSEQPVTVKVGAALATVIFVIGILNSVLSIIVFSRKKPQEVGCGIYMLASSITSLFIMVLFTLKFWFLFYSHQNLNGQQRIIQGNCFGIETLLKVFLYLDNWLKACVALERTVSIFQGVNFNKTRSKRIAVWVIKLLLVIICCLFIPQLTHFYIFHDEAEERSWCVVKYVEWLATYSTALIFIHDFVPLIINIVSIICTIVIASCQRARIQTNRSVCTHLRLKIRKNKHIIISPAIIVCLTLPNLIISIILDCRKASYLLWFYLVGYFLSFLPATFVFIIFFLPSRLYRKELTELLLRMRRRYEIFKLNRSSL
jgi:hypothetical protein